MINSNNVIKLVHFLKPIKKSLIYFDIPYRGTKQYDTSKNFNYESFYQHCKDFSRFGNKVFISEYNMPEEFKVVWQMDLNTHMNRKTEKRVERLYTI